jgi:hypothetical protein
MTTRTRPCSPQDEWRDLKWEFLTGLALFAGGRLTHCEMGRRGATIVETQHQRFSIPGMATTRSILQDERLRALRHTIYYGQAPAKTQGRDVAAEVAPLKHPVGKHHLEMQALPIGRPDPQARRQILQRKSHGKADARGLTGAEIAERQLNAREKAEKKAREQQWQVPKEGESQGGTSITLAIRSPERPSRATLPSFLPASTAPPRLQREESPEEEEQEEGQEEEHLEEEEYGRGKRRRVGTISYREGREQGLIGSLGHSQPQHHA